MFTWIINLREPVNGLTHIIGSVLAIIALVLLVYRAASKRKILHAAAFSVCRVSQLALYTMSALAVSPETISVLQRVEHAMIYLLIAGSYTPLCLIVLRGKWGWSLLGINWGLAVIGMSLKLTLQHPPQILIIILFSFFIIMGWLIVITWRPLNQGIAQVRNTMAYCRRIILYFWRDYFGHEKFISGFWIRAA